MGKVIEFPQPEADEGIEAPVCDCGEPYKCLDNLAVGCLDCGEMYPGVWMPRMANSSVTLEFGDEEGE